jgi:hypothetical protein
MHNGLMKTFLAALTLLAAPVAAHAAPLVEAAFGNTLVSTYPDGRVGRLWLKPGGAYDYLGRNQKASSGRWVIKGDEICLHQNKPIPMPITFCTDAPSNGGIGASWPSKAVSGEPVRMELVKGIVR